MLENSMAFLKKLRIEIPYDPAISCLGISPKETKSLSQRDICPHPMLTAALLTIAKTWKQPKCPSVEEWIKMWSMPIQWNVMQL